MNLDGDGERRLTLLILNILIADFQFYLEHPQRFLCFTFNAFIKQVTSA